MTLMCSFNFLPSLTIQFSAICENQVWILQDKQPASNLFPETTNSYLMMTNSNSTGNDVVLYQSLEMSKLHSNWRCVFLSSSTKLEMAL